MPDWTEIEAAISRSAGGEFRGLRRRAVGGGCINRAMVVESADARYFVKINRAERHWMFEAEAKGLTALAESSSVIVPAPVCSGVSAGDAFLVLEHLPLGPPSSASAAALGAQLAALHATPQPCFGFDTDNAIGSTPQPNPRCEDWVEFFRRYRLEHQLGLADHAGRIGSGLKAKGARLCDRMGGLFAGYAPAPSLLHGDLWSGNFAALENGDPVIFDPAVYWGDREADLAMTELFGGFPRAFYGAYAEAFPLDPGYRVRRTLYNLYHVLNHLNLFGSGYARQAEDMLDRLLAELG
ncbi:MAG TPA: fructosamine kinase family protein [Gammaproteobacteria bacterium]|nr:fructosamine kinase family protein [Gammaproteobacteria bacterium]